MKLRKVIKEEAGSALRGHLMGAWGAILTAVLATGLIHLLDASVYYFLGFRPDTDFSIPAVAAEAAIVTGLSCLLMLWFVLPLKTGVTNWYLEMTDRRRYGMSHVFWPFESRVFLKSAAMQIIIAVKAAVVSLVLMVIPGLLQLALEEKAMPALLVALPGQLEQLLAEIGISVTLPAVPALQFDTQMLWILSWAQIATGIAGIILLWIYLEGFSIAGILICEKYQYGVRKALKSSRRYMRGHKREMAALELSFLPWLIPLGLAVLCPAAAELIPAYRPDIQSLLGVLGPVIAVIAAFCLFYAVPYYKMTRVMYSRYLLEEGIYLETAPEREAAEKERVKREAEEAKKRAEQEAAEAAARAEQERKAKEEAAREAAEQAERARIAAEQKYRGDSISAAREAAENALRAAMELRAKDAAERVARAAADLQASGGDEETLRIARAQAARASAIAAELKAMEESGWKAAPAEPEPSDEDISAPEEAENAQEETESSSGAETE